MKAPDAVKVQIQGGDGLCPKPLDMEKDIEGNWNIIIPDAGVGFHYYWFIVDGVQKLEVLGIKPVTYISQGTFHEWHTWRRHLNEFAPLLFK